MPVPQEPRDLQLIELETQIRACIRDAVNRSTRKPLSWGGLSGYRQLEAIAQALQSLPLQEAGTEYLRQLATQVERTLKHNHWLAQDLKVAHDWLGMIAQCLRFPDLGLHRCEPRLEDGSNPLVFSTSAQIRQEMEQLLEQFQPNLKRQPAQAALYKQWHRLWKNYGASLLHCYDIPGLPPDNLHLEALFGRLRRHTRRISGRKSTRELRDFGQYMVLFAAESPGDLLQQLQQVSLLDYQTHRHRLATAQQPHQLLRRLHRDPLKTMLGLVRQHTQRRTALLDPLSPLTPTSVIDVSKCHPFSPPLAQAPHDARLGYASTV